MGMAYDLATRSTVLFGGANSGTTYGDTWNWRGGWLQLSPATSPSPRLGAGMAYDGAAGNIVLFGGQSSLIPAGTYLNDTWTWDGTTWTQQFPPVSPPARSAMGMVYDVATKTVLGFGGANSGGILDDTWTWDGVAKTWTQQNPTASPSARSQMGMAYDAANQTVVFFGGYGSSVPIGDTWTWNGTTWIQQFPASVPPTLTGAGMAYDAALRVVVLFGGCVDGIWEDTTNETWIWNGINWRQIHPATVPPDRYLLGMDYDPIHHDVLMFGGYSSTVVRSDTWFLALEP